MNLENIYKRIRIFFQSNEATRPTRTRGEASFDDQSAIKCVRNYVDLLWKEIDERLVYFDKDGSTNLSEAPAEGIFSIIDHIIEYKPSLSVQNMIRLCRIVKEGPRPGSRTATLTTRNCFENWPSDTDRTRGNFITREYNHRLRITSPTVTKCNKR